MNSPKPIMESLNKKLGENISKNPQNELYVQ